MKITKVLAAFVLITIVYLLLMLISHNDYEKDGYYYSSSGKFKFPIPVSGVGKLKMTEGKQSLSFTNDWCELYRVDYGVIPEHSYQESKRMSRKTFLEHGLRNIYIATFLQPNLPEGVIGVDHVEYKSDIFNGSIYAQLDVPKGSVCEVRQDGGLPVREDAKRGVLAATYGNKPTGDRPRFL